jgi:hypothetical protein
LNPKRKENRRKENNATNDDWQGASNLDPAPMKWMSINNSEDWLHSGSQTDLAVTGRQLRSLWTVTMAWVLTYVNTMTIIQ